nr:EAL domain-containing protein [Syntrophomonas palmitatica]
MEAKILSRNKSINQNKSIGRIMNIVVKKFRRDMPAFTTLTLLLPELEKALERHDLGVIYIDVQNYKKVEILLGRENSNRFLDKLGSVLHSIPISFCGDRHKLGVCALGGDDFLIFVDTPYNTINFSEEFAKLKQLLEMKINEVMSSLNIDYLINIYLGYTEIHKNEGVRLEFQIFKAIKEVSFAAKKYGNALDQAHQQLMRQIILHKQIDSNYQPIISMKDGNILGFEALSKGPRGTIYENPLALFKAAQKYQCSIDLELTCLEAAISSARDIRDRYLFLNVDPAFLSPANSKRGYLQEIIRKHELSSSNIVLEITERTEINDYSVFRNILAFYRSKGFKIAIDDAGAGYSSLQAIAELNPDFLKMDMSLVRDVDKNAAKKALLETFLSLLKK